MALNFQKPKKTTYLSIEQSSSCGFLAVLCLIVSGLLPFAASVSAFLICQSGPAA
jgi:hypothetical protein